MEEIELFVPGRLGIIGEISDLVSPYLEINSNLIPGHAISVAIDKGIYTKARKSEKFEYQSENMKYECELTVKKLNENAESNSYYSYMCGTVLYIVKNYKVKGIALEVVKKDLPEKKGLASSASICLTIAKAYNELYNLKLGENEIKNIAYEGEHLAQSKCGRLDQESIINKTISHIIFEKDKIMSIPIKVKKSVYILMVDLGKEKNTKSIMSTFNNALPFPKRKGDQAVHDVIGKKNKKLVENVCEAFEVGNVEEIGKNLNEAQLLLDKVAIICDEFKSPMLHRVLNDEIVKKLTYGGKSSGSGGDGTLVLICKDEERQTKLKKYIEKKYKMDVIKFCIKNGE